METKPFQWPDSSEADGPGKIIMAVIIRDVDGVAKARVSCAIPAMTAEGVGEVFGNAVTAAITSGGFMRETMTQDEKIAFTRGFQRALKQNRPRVGEGAFASKGPAQGGI